ncbi:DUF6894 family protein [Microvirga aerilata]|uniref:DUF6894 family protein n=1 Tax=Microvirga aerilata TaxID=670292 RepID=UPI0035E45289
MAQYQLFLRNKHDRYKYPMSVNVSDIEAAHCFALRMANVLLENTLLWRGWSAKERTNFVVDVTDEPGQAVLTVPSRFVATRQLLGSP